MKILVIGNGGREHSLIWKLSQSTKVDKIYSIKGNAGIENIAYTHDIDINNIQEIIEFVKEKKIDLTIVGPEAPLVMGIVDRFEEENLKIFGPNKECSKLEGSKIRAKKFMSKYNIPTAKYVEGNNYSETIEYLEDFDDYNYPVVIKADGLAAGKGVKIAENKIQAIKIVEDMMKKKVFGKSGEKIIIEEYLEGEEVSIMCFVDGNTIKPMESVKDYKKAYDDGLGPNTGGMGSYSPNKIYTKELEEKINKDILQKIKTGLEHEGLEFKGVLFIGLMVVNGYPKVLEFNVRFGDPETQALMPRLKTDLVDIIESILNGRLENQDIEWDKRKSVCVILTSRGYPLEYEKGKEITGLNKIKDTILFHAGTKSYGKKIKTNGGRVIGLTSLDERIDKAREKIYNEVKKINFEGKSYRSDIGK